MIMSLNTLQAVFLDQLACDSAVVLGLHLLLNRCQRAVIHNLLKVLGDAFCCCRQPVQAGSSCHGNQLHTSHLKQILLAVSHQ